MWHRQLTAVIQMLGHFSVPVASSSNVEIALHLVQVQASIDAAAVSLATQTRRLAPFRPLLAQSNNIVDVLLAEPLIVPKMLPSLARDDTALAVFAELVDSLCVNPLGPSRRVALQLRRREDSVASGILDVDVEVAAQHVDDNVEIGLHRSRDALFDGKVVSLGAAPPSSDFAKCEDDGHDEHGDGPFSTAGRARYIFGLGFSCDS